MAANYWASTQRHNWQYSKEALADIRQSLEDGDRALVQQQSLPDRRLLSIFFQARMTYLKFILERLFELILRTQNYTSYRAVQ